MVDSWVSPLVNTVYGVLSFIGTAVTTVYCPPLVPLVSSAFAAGGKALDFIPKGPGAATQQEQHQLFMQGIRNSLEGINLTVWQNQEFLKENQWLLVGNQGLLLENQDLLKGNRALLNQLQVMLNASSEESRQMIRGLHVSLEQFESNMNSKFEGLKVFFRESKFNEKTLQPINAVWHWMNVAMQSQKKSDIEEFKSEFLANSPRRILVNFGLSLEHPTANPIIAAMENDVLGSRRILDNYMHLFSHLVVKVIVTEGFYYGLADGPRNITDLDFMENENIEFLEKLSSSVETAMNMFVTHVKSYKMKEELYWPKVVNTTIISALSNGGPNPAVLADSIKHQLDGIHTTDVLSIYAYGCSSDHPLSSYDCTPYPLMRFEKVDIDTPNYCSEMTPFMLKAEKDKLHVVVLRSKSFNEISTETAWMVQNNYNTYTEIIAPLESTKSIDSMNEMLGNDPLLDLLDIGFNHMSNLINGFVTYGKFTPQIRFTNNGTSILPTGSERLPHKFYGLNWI